MTTRGSCDISSVFVRQINLVAEESLAGVDFDLRFSGIECNILGFSVSLHDGHRSNWSCWSLGLNS